MLFLEEVNNSKSGTLQTANPKIHKYLTRLQIIAVEFKAILSLQSLSLPPPQKKGWSYTKIIN